jgi:hypothetical protein
MPHIFYICYCPIGVIPACRLAGVCRMENNPYKIAPLGATCNQKSTFKEEYLMLLQKFEIEYDERF